MQTLQRTPSCGPPPIRDRYSLGHMKTSSAGCSNEGDIQSKRCAWCGAVFYRHDGETLSQWNKRKGCGSGRWGYGSWGERKQSCRTKDRKNDSKACERIGCTVTFRRRADESDHIWERRRFCSIACTQMARRDAEGSLAPKQCAGPGCENMLSRRRKDGGLEESKEWKKRRFCSKECRIRTRNPPRPCCSCERLMVRRNDEGPKEWARRKYCSPACRLVRGKRYCLAGLQLNSEECAMLAALAGPDWRQKFFSSLEGAGDR